MNKKEIQSIGTTIPASWISEEGEQGRLWPRRHDSIVTECSSPPAIRQKTILLQQETNDTITITSRKLKTGEENHC